MGIYYDYVKSRPIGETVSDWKLKRDLLNPFFNLKPFQKLAKYFYDDNELNLAQLSDMGAITCNAREWNNQYR